MKGKISLDQFIKEVKRELIAAATNNTEAPFFTLTEVELQTEFGVEAEGGVGFKLFVDLSGKATASQSHGVTLKFKPIRQSINPALAGSGYDFGLSIGNITVPSLDHAQTIKDHLGKISDLIDPEGINFHVVGLGGKKFSGGTGGPGSGP